MPPQKLAPFRRFAFRFRVVFFACLVVQATLMPLRGAEAAKSSFDLPADALEKSVKRFAAQSGLEVLIPSDALAEIRTRAVRGEMSARQALDAMLAGTGLSVLQDPKTGAFAVLKKASDPNDAKAPKQTATDLQPSKKKSDVPVENPKIMTPRKSVALLASLFSFIAATDPLSAQAVSSGADNPSGPEAEKVIELSPFVVNSNQDTGYQATSTLAGTRLNTPIKDIGASISIYTKQFMDDLGATNAGDLLIYATGMEAAGARGNYSGAAGDINSADVVGDAPRVNPQQSRTRGLASPNFTRGFFTTDIPTDFYNVESVTVNRGPNAILFGVGSPAGVVENSPLRPNLGRTSNKIGTRYGNNDSTRATIDLNRVLVKDKLALRIAALDDDERFNQRPAFEKKERIFGALTFEPFKSTALRMNFESGRTRANRPITVMPFNSISDAWYAAGRPGFDWTLYDDPARNPNAATQNPANFRPVGVGQVQIFNQTMLVYPTATSTAPTIGFNGGTATTTGTAADAVRAQLFHPTLNRDLANDAISFYTTLNVVGLPAFYWNGANVLPGQQPGAQPAGIKTQGFTDFSAFDFKNRMIDETSRQTNSFHAFNVALEQRAWQDRIGIEVAYDSQSYGSHSKNSFFSFTNGNHILIDTNVTLPTGAPNPNLGRPFATYGQNPWNHFFTNRETWRATGYLRYDFADLSKSWGSWLGRHTFTGLYEDNAVDTIAYSTRLRTTGPGPERLYPGISTFNRLPAVVVYLGPSIIGNNNPLQLNPIQIPAIKAGPGGTLNYFVRDAGTTDAGHFVEGPVTFVETNGGGSLSRQVIKSQATVLQSYWLRNYLVTTVGWRRDESFFGRQNVNLVTNPANLNDPGKVHWGFNDLSFPNTPPRNAAKEITSYSAVLRWPDKLIKLPRGTELSAFYNKSENFTPVGGRINAYNEEIAPPRGTTEEFGFNLFAFSDKFNMRVSRFKTAVTGQGSTPFAYLLATQNAVLQIASFWATEGNRNPGNVAFMNAAIEKLFSPLPANYRALNQFEVTGTAPTLGSTFTGLPGKSDTVDYEAKGVEIDLIFNPTRKLRILANVAQQETVQTNSFPGFQEFVNRMLPVWNELRALPRNGYPTGTGPGSLPATEETVGQYVDTNVLVPYATVRATDGSASAEQRKWRANLVFNYNFGGDSIFGSKLKGWSVGGGVRWQDKLGIGYPTSRGANGAVTIAIKNPYYAPAETNVDARIGYTRKIWSNRIEWSLQLNVNNLIAGDEVIAIGAQPWGAPSSARIGVERRWYLTNNFSF